MCRCFFVMCDTMGELDGFGFWFVKVELGTGFSEEKCVHVEHCSNGEIVLSWSEHSSILVLLVDHHRQQLLGIRRHDPILSQNLKLTNHSSPSQFLTFLLINPRNIEDSDDVWINETDKKAQATLEKLELELNSYKTNFIKESVRMAYNQLGDFFLKKGDFQEALKSFIRTRDYSNSSPQYLIDMCLRIIKTSLYLGNYSLVQQYVTKAYQVGEKITDEVVLSKLRVASALADLDAKRYKSAALKFIECNIAIDNEYNDVATAHDIALYGGVCALASFTRRELSSPAKKKNSKDDKPRRGDESVVSVINNMNFENFLELVPDVRAMIVAFYESKYSKCLENLNKLLPVMMTDVFLCNHALYLYETIRSKALKQYVSPFTSVDMQQMAATFSCPVEDLEKDLARLIQNKEIKARIDSHNKILYARVVDQRTNTFEKIIRFGDEFVRETESNILRMNLLKHQKDFVIKAKKSKKVAQ